MSEQAGSPFLRFGGDERRRGERRSGTDRRGVLRWDPRSPERERRSGKDRRRQPRGDTPGPRPDPDQTRQ